MTRPSAPEAYPNLDLLRTVAVLFVYVYHLAITMDARPAVNLGRIGVLLFFVHTSLVLMMSLERLARRGEPLVRSFYLRRAFRIYPLSITCVLLIVIFHLPRAPWWPYSTVDLSRLLANLLLYMNLVYQAPVTSPLWSLPYEVQMYVALPFVYLIGQRFGLRAIALLWLVAVAAGATIPPLVRRLDIFTYGPCFIAGVVAYFAGFGRLSSTRPPWLWPAVLVIGAALFHAGQKFGFPHAGEWTMCLFVGWMAPRCCQLDLPVLNQVSHLVARYSYGIYLTHLYAMWVAFVVLGDAPGSVQWLVLSGVSVILPVVLYHAVEAPFIRHGARLASRLPRAARGGAGHPRVGDARPD